jgi:hypothetical protein
LTDTTALPESGAPSVEASGQQNTDQIAATKTSTTEATETAQEGAQTEGEGRDKAKPEKTPEERERQRMQRGIDRRTRQLAEAKAEAAQVRAQFDALTRGAIKEDNRASASDSEPLTLTREQLAEMVKAEAHKLAPTLKEQSAEVERRQGVIQSLAKTWGQEKFDEISSDLDDALGGLTDSSGRPKPAIEAVFEADNPAVLIEFLADPDNADEAERIARMGAIQAGKAIARLEDKLKAAQAKDKPQPSKLPPPIESVRGQGAVSVAPDPSNTKAWIAYRNEQERKGL